MKKIKSLLIIMFALTGLIANSQSNNGSPTISQLEKCNWELLLANGEVSMVWKFNNAERTYTLTYNGPTNAGDIAKGDKSIQVSRYYLSESVEKTKFEAHLVGKSTKGRYIIVKKSPLIYKGTERDKDKLQEDKFRYENRMARTPTNQQFEILYIEHLNDQELAIRKVHPLTFAISNEIYLYKAVKLRPNP